MKKEFNETIMESEIICPVCGYKEPDSLECANGQAEFEHDCHNCGIELEISVDVLFSATVKQNI